MGRTALGVARVRASESARPDRLFDDPLAAVFAAFWAPEPREHTDTAPPGRPSRAALAFHVVIRTRFFDEFLLAAAASGCRQVVLLAAGLDTRAFRLPWPDQMQLFELDLPAVLDFKESILREQEAEANCTRHPVSVDLREDWPSRLTGAGFDPDQQTAWLAEGLLAYLDDREATDLLTAVGGLSAPGSRLSFELGGVARAMVREGTVPAPDVDAVTSLWRGGLAADATGWLGDNGWAVDTHNLGSVATTYGRPAPAETRSGFVTATRR